MVLKWNQPSIDFYEKCLHAKAQDGWLDMRLEEEGIENLKNITTGELVIGQVVHDLGN